LVLLRTGDGRGQRTTEFTAVVQPASSVKGLSEKELASIKNQHYYEKFDVFLAESGLPVRVIASRGTGSNTISRTIDILAVNVPVKIKPPPRRETISEAEFMKLLGGDSAHTGLIAVRNRNLTTNGKRGIRNAALRNRRPAG
jgi:hypothetical protein